MGFDPRGSWWRLWSLPKAHLWELGDREPGDNTLITISVPLPVSCWGFLLAKLNWNIVARETGDRVPRGPLPSTYSWVEKGRGLIC